jgi:hypothetical protein
VTLNEAEEPLVTVALAGCEVILTGVFTVKVALPLDTLPNKLLTRTL